jgi:hypothetical protein
MLSLFTNSSEHILTLSVWEARKGGEENKFREKCSLSSSKVRVALKKQTARCSSKSYREFGRKIQVQYNTVKKYLIKMGVQRKTKNASNRGCQVYSQDQVPSESFVVDGCQWKRHKRTSVFQSQSTKKCTYQNVNEYFINLWPDLASAYYAKDTKIH